MEPVGLKSYMLVRVGLDVKEDEWFGLRLGLPEVTEGPDLGENPGSQAGLTPRERPKSWSGRAWKRSGLHTGSGRKAEQETENGTGWSRMLHPLRNLRLHRMRRRSCRLEEQRIRRAEQERERLLEERKERIRQAGMAVERLAGEILELAEDRRSCRLVYEGAVRKALVGAQKDSGAAVSGNLAEGGLALGDRAALYAGPALRREQDKGREPWQEQKAWAGRGIPRGQALPDLWRRYFEMEEFQDYTQRFWADCLLSYARLCHYVILGTAPCIYEITEEHARRMKSLRWLLLERDCDQRLQDFVEDFYTEYGLAIELRTFESMEAFKRLRPLCSQPSNIIDFTGAVWPFMTDVAEGSIWLDMFSSEEKKYRLQGRRTEVEYVSLKEEWKRAKRRCAAPASIWED